MAGSLKTGFSVYGSYEAILKSKSKGSSRLFSSVGTLQLPELSAKEFLGKSLDVTNQTILSHWNIKASKPILVYAQAAICFSRAMRWWEKTLKPNMVEIHSAKELADSLSNAGDRLVIIDFYSPECGGCKALHPKIYQLLESNPDSFFLKVNYEELKTMCHALHIHVLPFFRFYRDAEGKVCRFSCTNGTIKKFKDALTRHGSERCGLGPAKGLDESEFLALASIDLLSRNSSLDSKQRFEEFVLTGVDMSSNRVGLNEVTEFLMA